METALETAALETATPGPSGSKPALACALASMISRSEMRDSALTGTLTAAALTWASAAGTPRFRGGCARAGFRGNRVGNRILGNPRFLWLRILAALAKRSADLLNGIRGHDHRLEPARSGSPAFPDS